MAHSRDALVCSRSQCPHPPVLTFLAQWESGYDESVEVNQRALIDKVLARYSAEFTGASRFDYHSNCQGTDNF